MPDRDPTTGHLQLSVAYSMTLGLFKLFTEINCGQQIEIS
jgi:hypothetical protein